MSQPFETRIVKKLTKTITFSNVAGGGAIGTVALASVNTGGLVWIQRMAVICSTTFTGTSATLALGCAGNTNGLFSAVTATTLTNGKIIGSNGAGNVGVLNADTGFTDILLALPLIFTVGTANITAGALTVTFFWTPAGGNPQGQLS